MQRKNYDDADRVHTKTNISYHRDIIMILFNLQHSSCKHLFSIREENSVDSVQQADLDLQFSKKELTWFSRTNVKLGKYGTIFL